MDVAATHFRVSAVAMSNRLILLGDNTMDLVQRPEPAVPYQVQMNADAFMQVDAMKEAQSLQSIEKLVQPEPGLDEMENSSGWADRISEVVAEGVSSLYDGATEWSKAMAQRVGHVMQSGLDLTEVVIGKAVLRASAPYMREFPGMPHPFGEEKYKKICDTSDDCAKVTYGVTEKQALAVLQFAADQAKTCTGKKEPKSSESFAARCVYRAQQGNCVDFVDEIAEVAGLPANWHRDLKVKNVPDHVNFRTYTAWHYLGLKKGEALPFA